ncbi:hypothetical protein Leryth_000647 [Lithospermum erythrorhizon]|nr:hypothetical protein Leryth_000647 [Lithospermum erythrorhizon]
MPSIFASILFFHILPCHSFTSFIFGDSLVDAGNNDYLFTLSKADFPPYGIDFIASGGQPTGRFTNGRTISDLVGQALGAPTFPLPYLSFDAEFNATTIGINYASGASGILDETGSVFIGRIPLKQQISYFEETRRKMMSSIGEVKTKELLESAIFSFTIGSNDILNYFQPSLPLFTPRKASPPSAFQDFMVSNFTTLLKRLHKFGARKFVIVGVGPLGCIPFIRATRLVPKGQCSATLNDLARGYNQKLQAELNRMNRDLGPEALFIFANVYDIVRNIILNHDQYGFENGDGPCCGGSIPPFMCYKAKDANISNVVCDDRDKYVFWDAYHPTEAANRIIAQQLFDGDKRLSYPINIRALYNYHFDNNSKA